MTRRAVQVLINVLRDEGVTHAFGGAPIGRSKNARSSERAMGAPSTASRPRKIWFP
jgi:hypothetical protein